MTIIIVAFRPRVEMASDHPFSLAARLSREVFIITAPISGADDLGHSRNCLMLTCQLFQDGTPSNSLRLWLPLPLIAAC